MGDHEDQPTTNSIEEEVDPQEQDVRPGSVRSYECIFCKRGFTTAQALGGHMNIHRKDRAKSTSRPNYLSNNSDNNQDQDHSNFYANPSRFYPIFTSYPQSYIPTNPNHHQEGNSIHYNISSTSRAISHDQNNHQDNVDASTDQQEKMSSSSLQFGWSLGEDKDSRRRILAGDKEDELDLELRLGQI